MRNIFVGIPSKDGKINKYLVNFLLNNSDEILTTFINSFTPTDANRNVIVNNFLYSTAEWLFFVDDDMIPPLNMFELRDCGKDFISAYNLILQHDTIKSNIFEKFGKKGKLVDCICGCGCCLIHRRVFEKLKQPYFEFKLKDGLLQMSENINFNLKVRKAGIKSYVCLDAISNHLKTVGLMELIR